MKRKWLEMLAESYSDLATYWMGNRMVGSWQTVDFISAQAAHCAKMAAHYANQILP